jgi:glycerophosphoryl diester phosphodiesterase
LNPLISQAQAACLDGLALKYHPTIDAAAVRRIHDAGLMLYVWTVDEPAQAKRLLDCNVEGLITNRPGWLRAQLGI